MAWKADSKSPQRSADGTRIAWLLTIVVPMASIVLLVAAMPARAATIGLPAASISAFADEFEDEEIEDAEEECEEVEEGYEVCEEGDEESAEEQTGDAPEECLLRSARAEVFASSSRARLRLVIDYRSAAPTNVSVVFFLKGSRGPLTIGRVKRHFARQGRLQVRRKLTARQIEKARAAKSFVVRIEIPQTPGYCRRYNTERLTVSKLVHGKPVWLQAS